MRDRSFIVVAAVLALLLVGVGGAYAYDSSRDDLIAEGVSIGGIDVGGMRADEARAALQHELLTPLDRPLVVVARGKRFNLSAREARIRADVGGMVDEALAASRRGSIVTRVVRGLTGGEVHETVPARLAFSRAAVGRLVSRVRRSVDRAPKDATVSFDSNEPKVVRGRFGRAVDAARLRRDVSRSLLRPGSHTVTARVGQVRPKVTSDQLADRYPAIVIVERKKFRLKLYRRLKLAKTYKIAVGQAGLETPAGLYHVQNKAVNPAWNVPKRPWAGKLAGTVVPGGAPNNPLKARWLGIYDGAGIHGTDAIGSLGTAASHGCIRMAIPDVIEVYDRVPVGAPVYIS